MKNITTIVILLFVAAGFSVAQVAGKFNRAVEKNDTVIIRLESNEGEIEWQKSIDSITWEVVGGAADELVFVADQTTFFQVITTVEGCNPYISDMGSVTVFGEMSDIDGNTYKTITIGQQEWMAENLRVTHYPDGSPILKGALDSEWAYTDAQVFCWFKNDSATYALGNGALYNLPAAMNGASSSDAAPSGVQGVCPDGWHIPSDMEWQMLEQSLGMPQEETTVIGWRGINEGAKLAGANHIWDNGKLASAKGFGESGFNGLPTGDRTWDDESIFYGMGVFGTWWSATKPNGDNGWSRYLQYDRMQIRRDYTYKWNGNSVRCVKD